MKNFLSILLLLTFSSCNNSKIQKAIVKLNPTINSNISGIITLTQAKNGILMIGHFDNLNSKYHALHIHKYGDVTKKDGSGTGGHYYGKSYFNNEKIVGNLGNITNDDKKQTKHIDFISNLTIDDIIGRSIVIHSKKGSKKYSNFINSGRRVATGVIAIAKN